MYSPAFGKMPLSIAIIVPLRPLPPVTKILHALWYDGTQLAIVNRLQIAQSIDLGLEQQERKHTHATSLTSSTSDFKEPPEMSQRIFLPYKSEAKKKRRFKDSLRLRCRFLSTEIITPAVEEINELTIYNWRYFRFRRVLAEIWFAFGNVRKSISKIFFSR